MKKKIFPKIVCTCCVLATVSFILFSYEIKQFENGILDVVATSQDGYVRLVLDQINLKENREDEEIVKNILSTLDASNNKYWTFSKGDTLLFVKDVLETEKYKSFTASTYYHSISSQQFYDKLTKNKVIHEVIHINNHNYIASGTVFSYNGSEYRLALLSNEDAILENNIYLKGKTESCIAYFCTVMILLLMGSILAWHLDRSESVQANQKKEIRDLNRQIVELNSHIFDCNSENSKVRGVEELPSFVRAFASNGIKEGMTVEVIFNDKKGKDKFMNEQLKLLPDDVVCFNKDENSVLLLVIYESKDDMQDMLQMDSIKDAVCKTWRFNKDRG